MLAKKHAVRVGQVWADGYGDFCKVVGINRNLDTVELLCTNCTKIVHFATRTLLECGMVCVQDVPPRTRTVIAATARG